MNGGRGSRSAGYTIVETLIFLAVSGAMFITAMLLINGRQARAEFTTGVREFDAQLQDISNDVSAGFYDATSQDGKQIDCKENASPVGKLIITANNGATNLQGMHDECIFIGKAIQFAPDGNLGGYNLITLAGKRLSGGEDVTKLEDTSLTAVAPDGSGPTPDATRKVLISSGVRIACVMYFTTTAPEPDNFSCSSPGVKIDTMSYVTTFKGGTLRSGSIQADVVVPIVGVSGLGRTLEVASQDINKYSTGTSTTNPVGGIMICLQSTGTKQHAVYEIGGQAGRFTTVSTVISGSCG